MNTDKRPARPDEVTPRRGGVCLRRYDTNGAVYTYKVEADRTPKLHSFDDEPAIVYPNGEQNWYIDGVQERGGDRRSRVTTHADGTVNQFWYKNGLLHRDNDLPAVIGHDGTQMWYQDGRQHRGDDKPAIVRFNGSRLWLVNGQQHRDNGPAVIHPDNPQLDALADSQRQVVYYYRRGQLFENEAEYKAAVYLATSDRFSLWVIPGGHEGGGDLFVAGCRRFGAEEALSWWLSWKAREGMHRKPFIDAIRNYMKERK